MAALRNIGGSKLDDGALVGFGGRVGNAIEELARVGCALL